MTSTNFAKKIQQLHEIARKWRVRYKLLEQGVLEEVTVIMPATSKKQYRAMQAAAHGHSTLGIPAKVGKEFASATKSPGKLPERKKRAK